MTNSNSAANTSAPANTATVDAPAAKPAAVANTNATSVAAAVAPATAADIRQTLMNDIEHKWNKFSKQDISGLKSNDELVTQLVAKYGLEKMAAQRDVDAMMRGRSL